MIVARVPASTANLGPGFDALGMALALYAEVGAAEDHGSRPERARLLEKTHPAVVAFRRAGGEGPLWVRSAIPAGRGLGFSGAMRVGGLVAAWAQRNGGDTEALDRARGSLLELAIELEGQRVVGYHRLAVGVEHLHQCRGQRDTESGAKHGEQEAFE